MLMFPSMLESAANEAKIKVPPNVDGQFDKADYPHWHMLCITQLNRPMIHGQHFENAVKIAELTVEQIQTMTFDDCRELGIYP